MALYLDSSALVKLVVKEPQTDELRSYLGDRLVASSIIARAEVMRAVGRVLPDDVGRAEQMLDRLTMVQMDEQIVTAAAWLRPWSIRALDALHVATASSLGGGLEALVTYDRRMATAGRMAGLRVTSPGDEPA